jgi:hypothetical protein
MNWKERRNRKEWLGSAKKRKEGNLRREKKKERYLEMHLEGKVLGIL